MSRPLTKWSTAVQLSWEIVSLLETERKVDGHDIPFVPSAMPAASGVRRLSSARAVDPLHKTKKGRPVGYGLIESAKLPIAGCLACACCLAVLVLLAYQAPPIEWLDARLLSEIAAPQGSFVNFVASLFERLADWLPQVALVALACLVALRSGRPRRAVAVVALVAGVALVTQILKVVLAHPRYQPDLGYHQVSSTGFPSGHAAGALAIALAFLFVVPRSWRPPIAVIGIGLALAVSASVIVLNLHYPSDVLGGWLVTVGCCSALAILRVAK